MGALATTEQDCVERAAAEPMLGAGRGVGGGQQRLAQPRRACRTWPICCPMHSRPFPAKSRWSSPRRSMPSTAPGAAIALGHGRNVHLKVRPEAPVQLLLTGHMDTVFAIDHPFQALTWLEDGVLNGPGVADMKGGIAVMLAALKAVEASVAPEPRL